MDIFKSWLTTRAIAHRGLHNDSCPENGMSAFQNAIDANYPIELDVKSLDDGTAVVFHDNNLSRMTGTDGYIGNLKLEDLAPLKLLKSQDGIPTFAQVLSLVDGKVPLLIEIKNDNKVGTLEKSVLELLKTYKGEYAVQSFNPYSMEFFKLNAPHIWRGQLSCFFRGEKSLSFVKRFALKRMMLNKKISSPDFISYNFRDLPNRYVQKFSDLPVLAWTVRCDTDFERVKDYCNNIIFEGFVPSREPADKQK